jgi:glycine/serine hydroxymethyltransferase
MVDMAHFAGLVAAGLHHNPVPHADVVTTTIHKTLGGPLEHVIAAKAVGITANRNAVPFDPRPPMVASGVRLGTSALAARGLQLEDFVELGEVIRIAFGERFEAERDELHDRCAAIAARHPLYPELNAPALTGAR